MNTMFLLKNHAKRLYPFNNALVVSDVYHITFRFMV